MKKMARKKHGILPSDQINKDQSKYRKFHEILVG